MLRIILLISFLLSAIFANAQKFELLSNQEFETYLSHHLTLKPFKYVSVNALMHVDFSQMYEVTMRTKSAPQLPTMGTSIMLNNRGEAKVEVTYDSYKEIPNVEVAPSKGNLKRNVNPNDIPYLFGEEYEVNAFYPGKLAELSAPFIARDLRGVVVTVFPYQYNPVTKVLRVYQNLQIKVTNDLTVKGINEKQNSSSANQTKGINRSLFLNGLGIEKYTPMEEVGDLLIICPAEMDSVVQILANWKNQKGIKTKVVHTAETGMGVNNIKSYIANYYQQNGDFLYLLLVGDHEDIPSYTYGESYYDEQLWSDSYYGQLAGDDFYPELFVGRFSGNLQEVSTMVQRTIEYEKNPATGNWMQKAIGVASQEGAGFGLNGLSDWQHMREMGNELLSASYVDAHEFYEGSQGGNDATGNPTSLMVSAAIDDGVGLLNYTGHGDLNLLVTSNFTSTSVMNLNNFGKYPWVISVACNNGTFSNKTCISEKWLRASKNGSPTGAISACGSSILMAWTQPMKTQKEINGFIANSDPFNSKKSLGSVFYNAQMKMLEQYPGEDGEEVMQTWIFFGDPTVEIRNQETRSMNVSHQSHIDQTENSVTIHCDVENTLISVSQEHVFLGKGIVSGGAITIALSNLQTNMPLTVTATKQNYEAYQGSIQVGNGPLGLNAILPNEYVVYPNPSSHQVQVVFLSNIESTITLVNATGQVIKTIRVKSGSVNETISLEGIAKGIYQLVISNSEIRKVQKLIVE